MNHQINMISLFTGIGGFDLAAETLGWNILFQSEIDEYCIKVLEKQFPNVVRYGNINEIKATKYRGHVDVVVGGFPCQPFSNAGLQQGAEDPRFLWPQMYRVIRECRPTWVVAENVLGLISNADGLVFEQVCADLESEGYKVQPFVIPTAGKDSFQERKRVWIIACLNSIRSSEDKVTPGEHFKAFRQTKKQLPNCTYFESWFQSIRHYSEMDGVVYGIPDWMDRTHALGNAIDPRIAYEILITIDYLINN
jgi:DNA-cytosine methyltransferase